MTKPLALVIEDEERLSSIFEASLDAVGFQVECILNGYEAYESLRTRQSIPDLIVLDLHLPEMSGAELLDYIRGRPPYKNTKVMLVTADQFFGETLRKDADLLLLKPVSIVQLQALAKRIIRH